MADDFMQEAESNVGGQGRALGVGALYSLGLAPFLGPFALLGGAAAGFLTNRHRKSLVKAEADRLWSAEETNASIKDIMSREYEMADPEEKRRLDVLQAMRLHAMRGMISGDPNAQAQGQNQIQQLYTQLLGMADADQQRRVEDERTALSNQRSFIGNALNDTRSRFMSTRDAIQTMQLNAKEGLELVSDPDVNIDSQVMKAKLLGLLTSGGMFYRDTPDMLDAIANGAPSLGTALGALRGGAGGAIVGDSAGLAVQALIGAIKSDKFNPTREEYNRIFVNALNVTSRFGSQTLGGYQNDARKLEDVAKRLRLLPDDYSSMDYIMGADKSIPFKQLEKSQWQGNFPKPRFDPEQLGPQLPWQTKPNQGMIVRPGQRRRPTN